MEKLSRKMFENERDKRFILSHMKQKMVNSSLSTYSFALKE